MHMMCYQKLPPNNCVMSLSPEMSSKAEVDPTHTHAQADIINIHVGMHNLKSIADRKQPNKKGENISKYIQKQKPKKKTEESFKIAKNTKTPRLLARNAQFKNKFRETRTKTCPDLTNFSKH